MSKIKRYIKFDVQEAFDYLMKHRHVYTLRKYKKQNGLHQLRSKFQRNLGVCIVTLICDKIEITCFESSMTRQWKYPKCLEVFVKESGFDQNTGLPYESVKAWLDKAESLYPKDDLPCGKPQKLYLYHVTRI